MAKRFPSPIGVFLFIYTQPIALPHKHKVSVPYRGLSFHLDENVKLVKELEVSVPYRGLSFYLLAASNIAAQASMVSVPYRGLSFYLKYV